MNINCARDVNQMKYYVYIISGSNEPIQNKKNKNKLAHKTFNNGKINMPNTLGMPRSIRQRKAILWFTKGPLVCRFSLHWDI